MQARAAKDFVHAQLAAAGFDCGGMVVQNAEAARDIGGSDGGTVAQSQNSADVLLADAFQDRMGRRFRRFKMNRNRAVAPGIIELMTAICNEHEIDAELCAASSKLRIW